MDSHLHGTRHQTPLSVLLSPYLLRVLHGEVSSILRCLHLMRCPWARPLPYLVVSSPLLLHCICSTTSHPSSVFSSELQTVSICSWSSGISCFHGNSMWYCPSLKVVLLSNLCRALFSFGFCVFSLVIARDSSFQNHCSCLEISVSIKWDGHACCLVTLDHPKVLSKATSIS